VGDAVPYTTLTARAERDLDEAWKWIARESGRERADALVREVAAMANLFASRPLAGRAHPELGEDIRSCLVRPYLVFYRPTPWGLEVVRVLHTRRDRKKAWREPG
jgi:toxin ParE1/3/4